MEGKRLDDVPEATGETFQQRLFRLIDASGMDDVAVYKRANIDRKVFSRIRCKQDYRPRPCSEFSVNDETAVAQRFLEPEGVTH